MPVQLCKPVTLSDFVSLHELGMDYLLGHVIEKVRCPNVILLANAKLHSSLSIRIAIRMAEAEQASDAIWKGVCKFMLTLSFQIILLPNQYNSVCDTDS